MPVAILLIFDHVRDDMAILKIARMGHPVLRRMAAPVAEVAVAELRHLIADMTETMHEAPGVGLAAPQVHAGLRLIVFRVPGDRCDGDDGSVPDTVLINPELTPLSERMAMGWEGCLSVPGLRGLVPRYTHIGYRGTLPDGRRIEGEATGYHARVIQHEYDHLDGILYIDRMPDLRLLTCLDEVDTFRLEEYLEPNAEP